MNAFQEKATETLHRLGVDAQSGLTQTQVKKSRENFGENEFSREKPPSLFRRIVDAFKEPMMILLIFAALVTLGVNVARYFTGGESDFLECVGIFIAILLSVLITLVMEGKSAKAFEALSKIGEDTMVKVLRDGETQMIPRRDLVVGDILLLSTGDKIQADGRLIESVSLAVDESALTGESVPAQKDASAILEDDKTPVAERANMVYSGCFVTAGSGKAVITGVGDHTEFGKIARELTHTEKSSTPLQEKMVNLSKRITMLGAAAAGVVFLVQLALLIFHGTMSWDTLADAFITSIILIVAAVPEGLPTIVAVSLAINIIKMSKQNALVKKMIACETVGCINVICSDKTGTLTKNRMTVVQVFSDGKLCEPNEVKDSLLLHNFCINGTADVSFEGEIPSFIGNPTECALLVSAHKSGVDYHALRDSAQVVHVYPFSSETKNMTTTIRQKASLISYTKGSPEKILSLCSLSPSLQEELEAQIYSFQEKACRVIAFAHKELSDTPDFETQRSLVESGMQFDGFVAITDPLREDVYAAVDRCRSAGIDLKILTGDNIVTASAIANDLHILDDQHIAVEAHTIDELSDEELADMLPKIRVIARSTPVIKMRVVNALKARGNVVAVTGDGINDAPAIKNADVGIAMGISGTEVSKEASDIVLLDDSFSTIVKAVQWGRGIYENFQRFIQFQLTVNLSSVVVVLVSILCGFAAPFSALELLWINLIMDGPPALTLGLEPIRGNLMDRSPTQRNASIVSKSMFSRIFINGLFISVVFMGQHFTNFLGGTPEQLSTILFTLFVVFQLFNAFNSRELGNSSVFRNFTNNKLMLGVFAFTFTLQVLITQFGGAFFGTVPLPLTMWLKIIVTAFSVILLSELVKAIQRLFSKRKSANS